MNARGWLVSLTFSILLAAGCGPIRDPVIGAPIVELSEKDAKTFSESKDVDAFLEGPDPGEAHELCVAALAEVLEARGYRLAGTSSRTSDGRIDLASPKRPLLILDAERAQDPETQLYPGLAGRLAIYLPGRSGPALEYVYYTPFTYHKDDRDAQKRHLRRALDQALEDVPERTDSR
jgi:hypothetical protein